MNKHGIGRLLSLGAIGLFIVVFALVGARAQAVPISLGVLPDVDSLPFVLAAEEGLFKEAGVDVELVFFKSALERDTAIQAGRLDGGVSDILAVAFARNAGFPVKIASHTDGRYRILASPQGNIREISQIQGKTLGISPNTIIEYATDTLLQNYGLDPQKVDRLSILDIPLRMQLLVSGQLNGACLPDPLATVALAQGAIPLADSAEMAFAPGVLVFTERALHGKIGEIRKLLMAYDGAVEFFNRGQFDQRFFQGLLDKAGFPQGIAGDLELPVYRPAGLPEKEEVHGVMSWLVERGLLETGIAYEHLVAGELWQ